MKRVTSIGVTDERIIHPVEIQEKLINLRSEAEAQLLLKNKDFVHIDCPACHSTSHNNAFVKRNFSFRECKACRTIFLSPRPEKKQLDTYYISSNYAEFLNSDEYASATYSFRLDEAKKRADRLAVINQKVRGTKDRILLYAPRTNILSETLGSLGFSDVVVLPAPWERENNIPKTDSIDVISAFDIIERLPNPVAEIRLLISLIKKNGMIMCTLRSGSGFDFLSLWQHSDIQPLEHMNLLTVEGAGILMENNGIKVQEISTPGCLDVQYVERIRKEKNIKINRFVDYFLDYRDEFSKNEFQQFLQRGLLSSHLVLVGQKS